MTVIFVYNNVKQTSCCANKLAVNIMTEVVKNTTRSYISFIR